MEERVRERRPFVSRFLCHNTRPFLGRILMPPPTHRVRNSLSPRGTSGERVGERGSFARLGRSFAAPLPGPLPTPSSWGEGIVHLRWWRYQAAPLHFRVSEIWLRGRQ